jgi:hypothetical protein
MGSTATSSGEALALTGAMLGHANPRSTSIYAHVQADPSKRAANRVIKRIAAALAGMTQNRLPRNAKQKKVDDAVLRDLAEQLAEGGPNAARIRAALLGAERRIAAE